MSEYLTIRETAERLKMHPDTVRDLRSSGQIKAVNVSRNPLGQARWRIPMEELERFIKRRSPIVAPVSRRRSRVKRVYT